MTLIQSFTGILAISAILGLSACGGGSGFSRGGGGDNGGSIGSGSIGSGGLSRGTNRKAPATRKAAPEQQQRSTIWDLLGNKDDPNITIKVNKYIWNASLEVLNFLPIEAADPFTGIISTGYGTPPGGGRAYKATIYIQDPALDARSLNIALRTRGGVVDADTQRAVEDAILTRARQLRIRDGKL